MFLLLAAVPFAAADSFMTSVEFVYPYTPMPEVKSTVPFAPEMALLNNSKSALEHAALLGRVNGYDLNQRLVAAVRTNTGRNKPPLGELDLGWVLMWNATYGNEKGGREAETHLAAALAAAPEDPNVHLVAALAYAQYEAFVLQRPWDTVTDRKTAVIALLEKAAELDHAHPAEGFDASFKNAVDYMLLYKGYAALEKFKGRQE